VSDGRGFVYRFPGGDFELGIGGHVPTEGETVRTKGRTWRVLQVKEASDKRVTVELVPIEDAPAPETASRS
jgi:hypothetical protein